MKKIISSLAGAIFWTALFIIGWGVNDWSSFFSESARTVIFATTFMVTFPSFLLKDKLGIAMMKKGKKEVTRHRLTVALPTLLWISISLFVPYCDARGLFEIQGHEWLRFVGMTFFLVGYLFLVWGPMHLGKNFSGLVTIQEGHKLITDGPFAIIRHPRYCGIILWSFGMALSFLSIAGVLLATTMSGLFVWRIFDEEKLLQREFGKRWDDYASHTKKLMPFVY